MPLWKVVPLRSDIYLDWIREQPCIVCQKRAVEAAHTGPHALGSKSDDFRALPMCPEHHRGQNSHHHLGDERFQIKWNIDLKELVIQHMVRFLQERLTHGKTVEI